VPKQVPNYKLYEAMSKGPETQIDPQMGEMLSGLNGKPAEDVRDALRKALDYGVRYALCSDFVVTVLDSEWKRLGGKDDDPAPWREDMK
jgi:hypothetical protein